MKAAESTLDVHEKTKPAMPLDLRRKLNDSLPRGFAVAVNYPPAKAGRDAKRQIVAVKLPRNVSKAPRGGVHIPQPAFAQVRLGRAGKHAYQKAKNGCFGSKKARQTIAAKMMLLFLGAWEAIKLALERRQRRALTGRANG